MNYNKKVSNLRIVVVNRPRIYLSWNNTKKGINKYNCYERIKDSGIRWINQQDRKSTRLNSSHSSISYAVFCL